jgi:hypothetical protein
MTNTSNRILGVTVLADFVLSEGVQPIVDNLVRAGVTAVATNPTVTAPAPEGTGTFQPPADAGSSPRTFDRKIFGKHALWVQSAPSFEPNPDFYKDSPYGPRTVKPLTAKHGDVIDQFITACRHAGLEVFFQIGAVQPTGMRDEDRPRQVDGRVGEVRMADTGSLASPAIREYNRAYVRDMLARYPNVDGFRIDWPEYPCYTMYETLHDFGPHVREWTETQGRCELGFEDIQSGMQRFHARLTGELTDAELESTRGSSIPDAFLQLAGEDRGAVRSWLDLKAELSVDLVADWRRLLDDIQDGLHLTAHAFMPPYSDVTGLNFPKVAEHCDAVSPKFYTMHWPLMVQFWSDWLLERNPQLTKNATVISVASWMELGTPDEINERVELYRYPTPDEPHPIPVDAQRKKLKQVRDRLSDTSVEFVPLVHGYGPLPDFEERFNTIWEAEVDGIWLNRYGYLSDAKLDVIGRRYHGRSGSC